MTEQVFCQDCKHYKPPAFHMPRCQNPDGIVWVKVLNNCAFYVAKDKK